MTTTTTNNHGTRHTVRELTPAIGAQVGVRFEDLVIACKVCDAKNSYGKVRLLVVPVMGAGAQWVELSRLAAVSTQAELEAL
jgi:hypothetical protein